MAVPLGASVTLTATAAPGYQFDGWAGDCAGLDTTCALLMDANRFVVASFKPTGDPLAVIHRFLRGGDGFGPRSGELLAYDGYLFGMTPSGGVLWGGTIFRELPDGSQYTIIHHFCGGAADGTDPWGSLIASGGVLYGMTQSGGAGDTGTIFKVNPDGSDLALLHSFVGGASDGAAPTGSLIEFGGVLYGMTSYGGVSNHGSIFRVNLDGSRFALLHSFTGGVADGLWPGGSLMASGGVLYGTTESGGLSSDGTIFKINPDGSGFTLLHSFAGYPSDGKWPSGSLITSSGMLYGLTQFGGAGNNGTIFKINPDGSGFTLLHPFAGYPSDGKWPSGSLITSGGMLYGMTRLDGADSNGTIFKVNPDGSDFALLHTFAGGVSDGSSPWGSLIASGGVLYGMTSEGGASLHWGTTFRINPDGSGFTLLHSFGGYASDASEPSGPPVAFGGVLYGMTSLGGVSGYGTIFRVNPDGNEFTLLHSFGAGTSDGANPSGSVAISDGVFYGMTHSGGASNGGTVFKVNPDGSDFSLLHSFAVYSDDGSNPVGSLVASGGVLYGMTSADVTSTGDPTGPSTIFRINTDGSAFAVLHSFGGGASDGSSPVSSLITSGGALYGVTSRGGDGGCTYYAGVVLGCGTIFTINTDGSGFTLLHSFFGNSSDGANPSGSLLALGGVLYGMTYGGGAGGYGTIFKVNPDGSGFLLLHSFAGYTSDGSNPSGSLIAFRGVFYGMTPFNGPSQYGTIFKINRDGSGFTFLHSFVGSDGFGPEGSSLTALDGSLYGSTSSGGLNGGGVLFRLEGAEPGVRRHLLRERPAEVPGPLELRVIGRI